MPRITPCRMIKFTAFIWLVMVWLWCSLPSPTLPPRERSEHIQKTLASGHPLVTVHDWNASFNPEDNGQMSGKALITRWQLATSPDQEVVLKIGDTGEINLGQVLSKATAYNHDPKENSSNWTPYFDKSITFNDLKSGDVEFSIICLDWFHSADKHLITHEMHGFSGNIAVQFVVPERGVLELWLAAVVKEAFDSIDAGKLRGFSNPSSDDNQPDAKSSHAAMGNLRDKKDKGLLVTFRNSEMKELQKVVVENMTGDLPSRTYPIRRALLVPLAPSLVIVGFLVDVLFQLLSFIGPAILLIASQGLLACIGIALSCWLRDGRPPLRQWTREFWMTRWMYRGRKSAMKVWGPTGPIIAGQAKHATWDEERGVGLQRPKTVKLGRS